jgi:hypothetical protein
MLLTALGIYIYLSLHVCGYIDSTRLINFTLSCSQLQSWALRSVKRRASKQFSTNRTKPQNRPSRRPSAGRAADFEAFPIRIRPKSGPISGSEALLRTIGSGALSTGEDDPQLWEGRLCSVWLSSVRHSRGLPPSALHWVAPATQTAGWASGPDSAIVKMGRKSGWKSGRKWGPILCCAIVLMGRASGVRVGFKPNSSQESIKIAPPRPKAGRMADFDVFPIRIRPKSAPGARSPVRLASSDPEKRTKHH